MFHLSHAVNTQRHVKSLKTLMKNIFYSPQSIYSVIHCINDVICLTKLDLFCYFFLMILFLINCTEQDLFYIRSTWPENTLKTSNQMKIFEFFSSFLFYLGFRFCDNNPVLKLDNQN